MLVVVSSRRCWRTLVSLINLSNRRYISPRETVDGLDVDHGLVVGEDSYIGFRIDPAEDG